VEALTSRLRAKRDYELVQAWMAVFLRLHGEEVARDRRLTEALETWRRCQESEGARVGELVGFCSGVVGFLRYPNKF
jgi:U3 small nucleolar RNA-associated protein 21